MLLMRANPLLGQLGGGWALEIETLLGPVGPVGIERLGECHLGPKKSRLPGPNPLPLAQVMDWSASKA
jgi:hypothetical protein